MSTQNDFDTNDIMAGVEQLLAELEPSEQAPLSTQQQSEVCALLWELSGHIAILRERACDGESLRTCNFAQRAILDLHGALPSTDEAMDAARRIVDAMPEDSVRKQAIAFKRAKRAAYLRKQGLVK